MELGFEPADLLRLPLIKKIGVGLLLLIVITAGYWQFSLRDQMRVMNSNGAKIVAQHEAIASKKQMLLSLPRLREELAVLKKKEAKAARKLPSKKEIPNLLTDISNAGHEQGLEFSFFAPKPELPVDVYANVLVNLKVIGPYHETLMFMNQVARLSRIVTFSDISMKPNNGVLTTEASAMTFRFLDESERPKKERQQKGKKGKKGKGK